MSTERFLPVVDEDSAGFWAGTAEDRLLAQRCRACASFRFPPSPICDRCRSWEFDWEPLPEVGSLYSWVVARHAVAPEFGDVPYVIGLVEFAPGVRVPGRLRDVEPQECRSELPVRTVFRELTAEIKVPEFVPAEREG